VKSTIVLLAICLSLVTTSQAGDQIPNFKLQDLDNQTVELAELLKKDRFYLISGPPGASHA